VPVRPGERLAGLGGGPHDGPFQLQVDQHHGDHDADEQDAPVELAADLALQQR
jgi:hypothetical protein